uniref:Uncharacterized protein n=1 Tax=Timema monikensis TaxID=170555 RepID=A0A7R9EFZ6_9NEOP|nr:unnamed protein product [Timema monikensis]
MLTRAGVAIGNGLCDPAHMMLYGDHLYQLGLIDVNAREHFYQVEHLIRQRISEQDWESAMEDPPPTTLANHKAFLGQLLDTIALDLRHKIAPVAISYWKGLKYDNNQVPYVEKSSAVFMRVMDVELEISCTHLLR